MMGGMQVRVVSAISELRRDAWNALVSYADGDNPSLDWNFVAALEAVGCATPAQGWLSCHFVVERGRDLVAVAPAYIKGDSDGDFGRDWDWAAAAARAGFAYYPKLVVGVPFTPVTGRRILLSPGLSVPEQDEIYAQLVPAMERFCRDQGLGSMHVLFPTGTQADALSRHGLARRVSFQYHWHNPSPGYRDSDAFYARFTSKRRNALRRERAAAAAQGIALRTVRGDVIASDPQHYADLAHRLHESTVDKLVWGRRWLNQAFYRRLFAALPQAVELVLAERAGQVVAGAFNLACGDGAGQGPRRLFGRYWGCLEEHPFLHFNVCYYHSIDECIARGVTIFEGGAGGEHKIARGFEPSLTYSAHAFFDPRLDAPLRRHLQGEWDARTTALARWAQQEAVLKPWPATDGAAAVGSGAAKAQTGGDGRL